MTNEELIDAYKSTTYIVPEKKLYLRIGEGNELLNELLNLLSCKTYAFITAYNPMSKSLSAEENNIRHSQLKNRINDLKLSYFEGYGEGEGDWELEISLLIIGISEADAIDVGVLFNQKAILTGEVLGSPKLKILDSYYL